ncbi:MAG: CARDB domain-containing protein [Candidatus Methylomirabilales bacterium]
MSSKIPVQHQRPLHRLVMPVFLLLLVSCATTVRESTMPVRPRVARVESTATSIALDIEDPGKIIVKHGSACGESDQPGEEEVVELAGSFTLPAYANAATVLLRGWQLRYLGGDEHLRWLSASIADIELSGSELSWVARGDMADDDFEDGYEFCYYYTVLAWNSGLVDALADHDNENANSSASFFDNDTTALSALSSYVENVEFAGKKSVAILPRGFQFLWANESTLFPACFDCPVDHHLLQIGYNMDHGEAFVQQGEGYDALPTPTGSEDASRVNPTIRSWESYSILKDDAAQHDYWFEEFFSALGGNDIGVIEPPFTILPREDIGLFTGCIGGPVTRTKEVEIRDVPFDYAIPMLTGWELAYNCDDQHVQLIGIRLEDIEYEKDPADTTGTLRYTVISELRDDDTFPGHVSRHKVTILGLNGREPADLVPHQSAVQFCNKDPLGRLLISVANNGADVALDSTTSVFFGGGVTVQVETPPIPAGFIVTLEPIVIPPSCPSVSCTFAITVDSNSEVTETNELNNVANGICIG